MFCEKCLRDVSKGQQRWFCPECRQPHECTVNTLTRNYRVETIVEKIKNKKPIPRPINLFGTCKTHERAIEYRK